jgi:glutamate-1-semialdehyde aminotransferase
LESCTFPTSGAVTRQPTAKIGKPIIPGEDYRDYCTYVDLDRYSRFVQKLLDYGIYMTPSNGLHWIISTAHRDKDVAALLEAVDQTCTEIA